MTGPDPRVPTPLPEHPRVKFLRPLAEGRPNLTVGEFAYYDDPDDRGAFFDEHVLHHYDFVGDRLTIGRFAAIAAGVRILMNGGAHPMAGFSTYPFNIFGRGWETGFDPATWEAETRDDTTIGPDVWIGTEAMILPGVTIGPGAVVAARSVVAADVAPYAVVAGNPARELRRRFDAATIDALLTIAWWDWPPDRLAANLNAVRGADLAALRRAAEA